MRIFFCICDHFEPFWKGVEKSKARQKVKYWIDNYPDIASRHVDSDDKLLKYSIFYPIEQYDIDIMEDIAAFCRRGYGEVEIHLHHENDTAFNLRKNILEYKKRINNDHGVLSIDKKTGEISYGFIHGNWALDNSDPKGRWCGVNDEISILQETGCYADFTMPSAPNPTQTRKINSIYYAVGNPKKSKSHDTGKDVISNEKGAGLLMIQGPLGLNWKKRKFGILPRIENGELSDSNPPTYDRIEGWIRAAVHVKGYKNWIFVKVHTHGTQEKINDMLFSKRGLDRMLSYVAEYAFKRNISLHFVSAREMANVIYAIEDGCTRYSSSLRDYRFQVPNGKH